MASVYKESQPQSVKWESKMHCAVYVRDVGQWQRGQISRMVSETSAEVLLYDSGTEKTVEVSCLRKLEENMKNIRTLAIECSLTEIRPTGGSTQWTATVCECLSYYLTGAQVKIITQVCNQKHDVPCALPVKILCKDETGKTIDTSEYLIEQGLALRNRSSSKTPSLVNILEYDIENVTISESEQTLLKAYQSLPHSEMDEVYKSPIVPETKIFQALVSCIGGDGTIYIIPKSCETALNKLMAEIQNTFQGLGLLIPYCWKKGEACVVRGSDTMWYRAKIVEVRGSTLQVQYIDHGYIESIPQCHLYPTTFYTGIPPFCIPCQLYKTLPVSNSTFCVYICLDSSGSLRKRSHTGRAASCDSESLDKALKWCNKIVKTLPHLTNFKKELPCLAEYVDGLWYRAKVLSITQLVPVKILVQFVDYGTYLVAPTSRLRHIPLHLLKYPVQAVRVLLAGFKPASDDKNMERIPYSPEWSLKALWTMVDCVEGKSLSTVSPEVTISLYGDDRNLVHLKLVEMGLAELDE
uniref:RING finger protein 17 n=1 Tax=Malurus cyaneus samueli TaxID=2593467 RepID=A0A8C5T0N7_9PASS